jgi:hypothetical protein
MRWYKSSRSAGNGECVEVAMVDGGVLVRDSKNPGSMLWFGSREWRGFVGSVRSGQFDRPQ